MASTILPIKLLGNLCVFSQHQICLSLKVKRKIYNALCGLHVTYIHLCYLYDTPKLSTNITNVTF